MNRGIRRSAISVALPVLAAIAGADGGTGFSAPGAAASVRHTTTSRSADNAIPPRLQWNENYGYCGEVAFVSAGLYFGQYLSQYDARAIVSNGTPQYEASAQLLLGANDSNAASRMHFTYTEWKSGPGTTARSFLSWVKGEVVRGYPVAIGVYTNESSFYGSSNPNAGDPEYDHIVMVTGVTSSKALAASTGYDANDVITFSDNGLWTEASNGKPPFSFSYRFGSFQATRQQANTRSANVYSLADAVPDFGIAITGIVDGDHETVPVRVATNVNYESPSIRDNSGARPASMPVVLTATVSGLRAGRAYHLYRYHSLASVPKTAFNRYRSAASQMWSFTASGTSYTLRQTIRSSDEAIYRAVPASAP